MLVLDPVVLRPGEFDDDGVRHCGRPGTGGGEVFEQPGVVVALLLGVAGVVRGEAPRARVVQPGAPLGGALQQRHRGPYERVHGRQVAEVPPA